MIDCYCHTCTAKRRAQTSPSEFAKDAMRLQMVLCPVCGNKRCPRASDHNLVCTGSNEPNQTGSVYDFRGVK